MLSGGEEKSKSRRRLEPAFYISGPSQVVNIEGPEPLAIERGGGANAVCV